jgi:hypothetical protein
MIRAIFNCVIFSIIIILINRDKVFDRQTGNYFIRGISFNIAVLQKGISPLWAMGRAFGATEGGKFFFRKDFDGSIKHHPCDQQENRPQCEV